MSDEKPSSGESTKAPAKQRRRRRRNPDSSGAAPKSSAPRATTPSDDNSGGKRQRSRKRRSGKRDEEKGSQGNQSGRSTQSRRGQASRRRSSEETTNSRTTNTRTANTPGVDTSKQAQSNQAARLASRARPVLDEALLRQRPASPQWGDDSDAPTPDITLKPDLPIDTARRDLDPSSAYLLEQEDGEDYQGALSERISNIISVRFAVAGRLYLYDAGDGIYERGDSVLVESESGTRVGRVATASQRRPPPRSLKKIIGRAVPPTAAERKASDEKEREFVSTAVQEARKLKLPIKIFRAVLEDGDRKLAVSYSCENKTDVRRLTRALSARFPYRVDLRHFGARDEAKLVGGIGSCGQELCCTTWLPAFVPVSIKNAKNQGLALNPSKLSGQCGRLKCCLVYEQEHYSELRKGLPKLGKRVITHDGFEGRVVEVDVLHQRIRVGIGRGESKVYGKDEVKPMFASQTPGTKSGKSQKTRSPDRGDAPTDDHSDDNSDDKSCESS